MGLKLKLIYFVPRKKTYRHNHKWGSDWLSLGEICKRENSNHAMAKFWRNKMGKSVREAVRLAKNKTRQKSYEYNGNTYNETQLAEVLAKEVGITKGGMRNRLKKGLSVEECKAGFRKASLKGIKNI